MTPVVPDADVPGITEAVRATADRISDRLRQVGSRPAGFGVEGAAADMNGGNSLGDRAVARARTRACERMTAGCI